MIQRIETRRVFFMGWLVECPGCSFYFPEHEAHETHGAYCEPCGEVIDVEMTEISVEVILA